MTLTCHITERGGIILADDADSSSFAMLSNELDQILAVLDQQGRIERMRQAEQERREWESKRKEYKPPAKRTVETVTLGFKDGSQIHLFLEDASDGQGQARTIYLRLIELVEREQQSEPSD